MLASGEAHLVASMGEATGPVPFTSYMTTPDFLRREPDIVLRFTRGLYRTQRWLAGQDATAIAETIAPDFPDIERVILERAVDRFSRQGTWARDPILRKPGFDYLQEILQTGGFIRKNHRYEDLVDTSIAERAVREM
jgi:NitT/TauT family transport system substrate-binding protein